MTVRHHPESTTSGRAAARLARDAARLGAAVAARATRTAALVLARAARRAARSSCGSSRTPQDVPGLVGRDGRGAAGNSLSLDRGPGGLAAKRTHARTGASRRWVVLGASRGEAGILGEGIRQALLRDPTYAPALEAATRDARATDALV